MLSLIAMSLIACKNRSKEKVEEQAKEVLPQMQTVQGPDSTVFKHTRDSVLFGMTAAILTAFQNKDYDSLASFIHPDEGLRFSPYCYVDSIDDRIVSANWIRKQAGAKQKRILWGYIDNTMEPIKETFDDYVKGFVLDKDFLHPEHLKVNEIIGRGNTISNIHEMYKGCDFTESHFEGIDKDAARMDWRSLRLVFKLKDGKYYLVGVVHDEWTT